MKSVYKEGVEEEKKHLSGPQATTINGQEEWKLSTESVYMWGGAAAV